MSTQNAPAAVRTKFGNRLRELAEDIEENVSTSLAEGFAYRLRSIASEIDTDHTETLALVNDISRTLNGDAAMCSFCGKPLPADVSACPRCGWKVGD